MSVEGQDEIVTTMRAVPFYCPFCGEQDIRPDDAGARAWRCDSCERGFELTAITVGGAG